MKQKKVNEQTKQEIEHHQLEKKGEPSTAPFPILPPSRWLQRAYACTVRNVSASLILCFQRFHTLEYFKFKDQTDMELMLSGKVYVANQGAEQGVVFLCKDNIIKTWWELLCITADFSNVNNK